MPEAIIIATAAGAAGGLATGAALGLTGAALATFALVNAGVALTVSSLQYALRDKPSEQKANIKQTIRAAVTPVRYVLGRCRLSGVLAYINTRRNNDRILDMALILSEGRCGEIERIWANGTEIQFTKTLEEGSKYVKYVGGKADRVEANYISNGIFNYIERTSGPLGPDGTTITARLDGHYQFTPTRPIDTDDNFGRGGIEYIEIFENGAVRTLGLAYNKDVTAKVTFVDRVRRTLIVEDVTNNKVIASNKDEVIAYYNQLADGDGGTVTIEISEGIDFTNKFTLYLYNNPANVDTNGKSLRDAQPQEWTDEHKLQGLTWCHIELTQPKYGNDIDKRFWNNIPDIQVLIQGKWITWPEQLVAKWTDNAAAIRYWYMVTRLARPSRYIDSTSVVKAFEKCEESVKTELTGDYSHFVNDHKRYTIDGLISSGDDIETILSEMDQAWQGNVIYRDGMYYFEVGEEPTEFVAIDRNTIIDSVQIQPAPALQERINSAGVVLSQGGPISDWTEFHLPTIDDEDAIIRDGQKRHHSLGTRQFISDPISAGRIMAIALKRARATMRLTYRFMPFTKFELGKYYLLNDIVFGLKDFKVRCEAIVLNVDWTITVTFSEYIDDTYADTLVLPPLTPRDILLPIRGRADVELPFNITLFARYEVTETGAILWWIEVKWESFLHLMEIEIDGPDSWSNTFETLNDNLSILVPNVGTYILTFIHVSNQGRRSEEVIKTINVGFDATNLMPPRNLLAPLKGNFHITITWEKALSGEPATSYDVEYKLASDANWTVISHIDQTLARTLYALEADTTYNIRVKARNSGGTSLPSNQLTTKTNALITDGSTPDTKPGKPVISLLNRTHNSVTLVARTSGDIEATSYRWRYSTDNSVDDSDLHTTSIDNEITISNLAEDTPYWVDVFARNERGSSPASDILAVRTLVLLPPGVPRNVQQDNSFTTDTAIALNWGIPNTGGEVTRYRIKYKKTGTIDESEVTSILTFGSFSGLDNDTSYDVQVRAEGPGGNSAYTSIVKMRTLVRLLPPGIPEAPTPITSTQTTVSVSTRAGLGGTPTLYRWRISTDSSITDDDTILTSVVPNITIRNLTKDSTYYIDVRAENAAGNSAYSSDTSVKTLSDTPIPPDPPRNLKDSEKTSTTVKLIWDAPLGGGPLNDYDVRYRLGGIGNWTSVVHSGTHRTISITGLLSNQSYEFAVQSKGPGGSSIWATHSTTTNAVPAPGKVRNLTSTRQTSSAINLSWDPPNTGGTVIGYDVEYKLATDSIWSENIHIGTGTVNPILNLQSNKSYNFRVRAIGPSFNGEYSDTYTVSTKALAIAAPVSPTTFSVRKAGTSFAIAWSGASGNITSYEIQSFFGIWGTRATITSTATSGSTTYTSTIAFIGWRIRAVGPGGNGAWVRADTVQSVTAPNAPTNFSIVKRTRAGAGFNLIWTAPSSGDDPTSYRIEAQFGFSTTWYLRATVNHPTVLYADVTTLGFKKYRVRSQNSAGNSDWVEASVP